MMKILNYTIGAILIGSLVSCGGGQTAEVAEEGVEAPAEVIEAAPCTYTLGGEKPGVYWTAYKHTGKIGVKGKMDSISVTGAQEAMSPLAALTGCKVQLFTAGVNSKDEVRDKKLREIYFGSMANAGIIEGTILDASFDSGVCTIALNLNDSIRKVTGAINLEEEVFKIRFTIEPKDWGAEEAIAKLGEACAEKHTGEDGETVFWPDVDVLVEVPIKKNCPDPV